MLAEPETTRADVRFELAGLPVRVHPWFWVVTAATGWDARAGAEPLAWWILVVFVSILVHELGHALVARAFGARDVRIVLYSFGGLAIHGGGALTRRQRLLELFMGPGAGFLLVGAAWLAVQAAGGAQALPPRLATAWVDLLWVNVVWGLVNLLPILPLDGGQMAAELLVAWRGQVAGLVLTLKVSCATAGAAVAGATWGWFRGLVSGMPAMFFLVLAVSAGVALARLRRAQREGLTGGHDDDLMPHERAAWERDPDWWK